MKTKYIEVFISLLLCMILISGNPLVAFADTVNKPSVQNMFNGISSSITNEVSESAQKAGNAISDGVKDAGNALSNTTQQAEQTAKKLYEKTQDVSEQIGTSIENGTASAEKAASNLAGKTETAIKNTFKKINPAFFKSGWEYMAKLGGSTLGAATGQAYINSVQAAIDSTRQSIIGRVATQQTIPSKSGFVAEEWIAGSFNADAIARGSKEHASTGKSNGLGSVDIDTTYGETASSKYYKDAKGSAKAQATSWMQEYKKYCDTQQKLGKDIPSPEEYLNEHSNGIDLSEIYDSIYGDQTRIIPTDQLDEAKEYLLQKSSKDLSSDDAIRRAVGKTNADTMKRLKDRLQAPDGTSSKPLTKKDAQAIAELCESGDFKPEDFGLKVSDLITPQYILKQSIGAGVSAAALRIVFAIGPQIYSIVSEAIKTGEIDTDDLKKMGYDGAIAGTEGFLEGSISCAILTACRTGKLGAGLMNASPDVIGALTVLAIDSAIYGYQLSQGKITTAQYADILAAEIFASAVAIGTVALLVHFLPAVPIIYLAGSMAGGMLGTAGYSIGKEIVLEVVGGNGFETIIPSIKSNNVDIGKPIIKNMNIKNELTDFKDMVISTSSDGKILVKPA